MSDSLKEICTAMWFQYEPELRKFCRAKLIGYSDDADDVLSKTFQIFWAKLLKDGVPPYPEKWLYITANNLIRQEYDNHKKIHDNETSFEHHEFYVSSMDNVDDNMAYEQLYPELAAEIRDKLTDDEKRILKLAVIDDLSYAEIAEIMGLTEDAVKQRKFRIVRKLQKLKAEKLKKYGYI